MPSFPALLLDAPAPAWVSETRALESLSQGLLQRQPKLSREKEDRAENWWDACGHLFIGPEWRWSGSGGAWLKQAGGDVQDGHRGMSPGAESASREAAQVGAGSGFYSA